MKDTTPYPPTPVGTTARAAIVAALAAGALAWVWLGEWRWAATALVLTVLLGGIGAALDGPDARRRRYERQASPR